MFRGLLALLLTLLTAAHANSSASDCPIPVVTTHSGDVCGHFSERDGRPVHAWLGIPYAQPPTGDRRFADPLPVEPWPALLNTQAPGHSCPQPPDPFRTDDAELPAPQDEDCLYLNIWAPAQTTAELLPVLVYIHGGGFTHGSATDSLLPGSDWYLQDGSFLASRHNLVVVSLNYRLGALGFLAQAGVTDLRGNYGFRDQLLALEWLHQNLAAFGGDPNRVTLAGESAGAMSVSLHLHSSPASAPLFRSAIIQSAPLAISYQTLEDTSLAGDAFLVATGCLLRTDQLSCLRSLPVEKLIEAQESWRRSSVLLDGGLQAVLPWKPVIDGELLVRQPLAAGSEPGRSKPMLLGFTADEGLMFVAYAVPDPLPALLYPAALDLVFGGNLGKDVWQAFSAADQDDARPVLSRAIDEGIFVCPAYRLAETSSTGEAFVYRFSHAPSFTLDSNVQQCTGRSCHATELSFVFGTGGFEDGFTVEEAELSSAMMALWAAFVKDGPPAMAPWPAWDPAEAQLLELATPIRLVRPERHNCTLFSAFPQ